MPFYGITVEFVAEFSESSPTFINLCHFISWNTLSLCNVSSKQHFTYRCCLEENSPFSRKTGSWTQIFLRLAPRYSFIESSHLIHIDNRHPFLPCLATGIGCTALRLAVKVSNHTAGMRQHVVVPLEIASVEIVITQMHHIVRLGKDIGIPLLLHHGPGSALSLEGHDRYQFQHGDAQLEGKDFFRCHHVEAERHAAVELVRSSTDGLQNSFLQPFSYLFLMVVGYFSMSGKGNRLCRCLYKKQEIYFL